MRLLADGAKGHCPGFEATHNRSGRFYLFKRNLGPNRLQIKQGTKGEMLFVLSLHQLCELLIQLIVASTHGLLKQMNGLRIEQMLFPTASPLIFTNGIQHFVIAVFICERPQMLCESLFCYFF
ncbi:hypothetical protein D1872_244800 [compost metagenome]